MNKIGKLFRQKKGATIVEFAIIAPTFLLLMLGSFDIGHTVYLQGVLKGAVLEAARDSTLESASNDLVAIDTLVTDRVKTVMPTAQLEFDRKSYFQFTDVDRPEAFEDAPDAAGNKNGKYDKGECFSDENGNGAWDPDVGTTGLGGPNDIVMYTVTVKYESLFPLYQMVGLEQSKTVAATTVLRNQPYGEESSANIVSRDCS